MKMAITTSRTARACQERTRSNATNCLSKLATQRVPVLIRIDDKLEDIVLRPGLSAFVTVRTDGR